MKVGIIGNYGHDNNGDEAILQGIIEQLTDCLQVEPQNIVVFSNHTQNTYERYGLKAVPLLHKRKSMTRSIYSTVIKARKEMKDLDVVLIGGGGLLMDMYKRDAPLYGTLAILARLVGCKVIIYGVGAGPIQTKIGKFFIRMMTATATSISVRDEQSKKLLQKIGVKNEVKVIADPAFQLQPLRKKMYSKEICHIGVTVVPYFSKIYWPVADEDIYADYVKGMAANLDQLIRTLGANVTLFSTKYPQDTKVAKDVFSKMEEQGSVKVITENLHPSQLVSFCAEQDLIIGTRLHSLILSVAAGTPVIGIGYHKKVNDFMIKIGKEENYVEINQLTAENYLLPIVERMNKRWELEQEEFQEVLEQQRAQVRKGIKQLEQSMNLGGRT